ncbi:undecaprenyl-diphosphate phosphatase [Saliniramus sp.]|uniref:undecaprenyl-diphosphate phosphatase n=1 Tax=Saliniramus sp. TaxID=2986772 RepID=UPI002CCE26FF|nr:undecaprenyl-diphosphate phosphatase [Saliniramus sp.]HMB10803.1 undecaprenyl-diphosphate phosphatase [Saliniramus sp.]
MTLFEAALLGIVQGVFMFVPVSSTAHLVLTQHFLIAQGSQMPPPESAQMILFDLIVHVGTLVSIIVVFRKTLAQFLGGSIIAAREIALERRASPQARFLVWLWAMGLLSVFVTGVMGLTFRDMFERVFANPAIIPITLATTGVLLWLTDRLKPRRYGLKDLGIGMALTIGFAQGLALIPGISRSGMTIIAALFVGLKRKRAAEYSFLIAFPTILAATLVQSAEVYLSGEALRINWAAASVGFVVSALIGTIALQIVLKLLYRAKLKYFSFYLWGMALLVAFGVVEFGK